jgi:hypothetical protein
MALFSSSTKKPIGLLIGFCRGLRVALSQKGVTCLVIATGYCFWIYRHFKGIKENDPTTSEP